MKQNFKNLFLKNFSSNDPKVSVRVVLYDRLILFLFFLLQACEIRHVNLNPYVGICAEFPDVLIVSEYCAKGSLQVMTLFLGTRSNEPCLCFLL